MYVFVEHLALAIHFNIYRYYTYVIIDYILALDKYAGT